MNFTPDMIEKAKAVKSPEELSELAKAAGMELSAESAAAYFEQLNPKSGELDDDDLENVSGGGCYNKNRLVVTAGTQKSCFVCKGCGVDNKSRETYHSVFGYAHTCKASPMEVYHNCGNCRYCRYENALWLCYK